MKKTVYQKIEEQFPTEPVTLPDPMNYPGLVAVKRVLAEFGVVIDRYRIAAWPPIVRVALEKVMSGQADREHLRSEWNLAMAIYGNVVIRVHRSKLDTAPGDEEWIKAGAAPLPHRV